MRRSLVLRRSGVVGLWLGAVLAGSAALAAGRETVTVTVDHAKVVRLPERTQTVVIGNPFIADVSTQRNGVVVLTGKSYGVTNMIALDGNGGMIAESLITVRSPHETLLTVQRGLERESYSCKPRCEPVLQLGDTGKFFGEVSAQAGQRNDLATKR